MQLSAAFLMTEGADFHRSQGYAQKQGVGILLPKLLEALGMPAYGSVTQAKGQASMAGFTALLQLAVLADSAPGLE